LTLGGSEHQSGEKCSKKGEARKETDRLCSDDETGEGMAKQRIKLKELKHEGHIVLGKWNSQWSHMQPYVGWALLFASVTCLQGHIRGELFVLGAQPLDMCPLGLCWHNKRCFLLICLKTCISVHNFPQQSELNDTSTLSLVCVHMHVLAAKKPW
jgi:hypothetical protein